MELDISFLKNLLFSTLSKSFYILWYDERTNVPFCQSVEDLDQEWLNQHAEIENLQWTQKVVFERRSPLPTRWYPGTCLSNSGIWSTKKWKVTIHILQNIDAKTQANCRNKQPLTNIVWFLKKNYYFLSNIPIYPMNNHKRLQSSTVSKSDQLENLYLVGIVGQLVWIYCLIKVWSTNYPQKNAILPCSN